MESIVFSISSVIHRGAKSEVSTLNKTKTDYAAELDWQIPMQYIATEHLNVIAWRCIGTTGPRNII